MVSRGAAKQESLKQASCTGRRREFVRSGFISNIYRLSEKGKLLSVVPRHNYHNLRAQYHTRHIQVSKSEALASSVRSNPDCLETQADSACIEEDFGTIWPGTFLGWGNGLFNGGGADFPYGGVDCRAANRESSAANHSAVRSQNHEADHPSSTGLNSTNGRSPLRCSLRCSLSWCFGISTKQTKK